MKLLVDGIDLKLDGRCLSNYVKNHIIGIESDYTYKFKLLKPNKMKNYEITEEQIREIETWGNSKDAQKVREEWFPEVFETKFKNGDWVIKLNDIENTIVCIVDYDKSQAYGFGYPQREWTEVNHISGWSFKSNSDNWRKATEQEVLEALKNEAIKRGFVKGAYFKELWTKSNCKVNDIVYEHFTLDLRSNGKCLFHNGKWAEIIKTYTKEEAEKLLNAKII